MKTPKPPAREGSARPKRKGSPREAAPVLAPHRLPAIGEKLFGPDWRVPMARVLGVQTRTIRRWERTGTPLSQAVANTLWLLARVHQLEAELTTARRAAGLFDFDPTIGGKP